MESKITSKDVPAPPPAVVSEPEIKVTVEAESKPKIFSFDSLDKVKGLISTIKGIGEKIKASLDKLDPNGFLKPGKPCEDAKTEISASLSQHLQSQPEKKSTLNFLQAETQFSLLPYDQQLAYLKGEPLRWSDAEVKSAVKPGLGGWKESRLRFAQALKLEAKALEADGKGDLAAQYYHSASLFAPQDIGLHADAARLLKANVDQSTDAGFKKQQGDLAEQHLEAVADEMQVGKVEKLIHDGKLAEADKLAQQVKNDFYLQLSPEQRKTLNSSPKIRARLIEVNLYQAEIHDLKGDHAKAVEIYQSFLPHLDKLIKEHPGQADAYLLRAKAHHNLQDYGAALQDYQALAKACPEEAGYVETYQQDLHTLAKAYDSDWRLAAAMQDPMKASLYLAEEIKVCTALGDTETVKTLSTKLAELSKTTAFGTLMDQAQSFAAKGYLSPLNTNLKDVQSYVSLTAKADSKGYQLSFNAAFQSLSDAKKLEVLQKLNQEGMLGLNKDLAAKESDPGKKTFYEGKVALLEGNLPAARLKWMDFKAQSKDSKDPEVLKMRAEAGGVLRQLSLAAVQKLNEWDRALLAQRASSLVSVTATVVDGINFGKTSVLLGAIQYYLESGKADTIEEALAVMQQDYAKLQVDFLKDPTIKDGTKVNYSELVMSGPNPPKIDGKDSMALETLFLKNSKDPSLLDVKGHPGVPHIKLSGGTLEMGDAAGEAKFPKMLRVVIGNEGGYVKTWDKTYFFPPGKGDRVVLVMHGKLMAGALKEETAHPDRLDNEEDKKKDFKSYAYSNEPPWLHCNSGTFHPGDAESLRLLTEHAQKLPSRDPDFALLFGLETRDGLEKSKTEEGHRSELLKVAKEIRHRTGSYAVAGEILEGLLAKDMQQAMGEISPQDMKKMKDEVEKDRPAVEKKVREDLQKLKKDHAYEFSQRFSKGDPSEAEVQGMVDQSLQGKLAIKVRKLAFEKLDARVDSGGQLSNAVATEAWKIYDDMKDPTDKTWNLADESWDGIVDEVVITAVTMPVTMGVGAAVRGTLGGTSLALRWAAQGGIRALAVKGGILFASAMAEGFTMEAFTPGEFELKRVGFNTLMSVAFHGGGKAWGEAAGKFGLDEAAIQALRLEGKSVAGKTALNFTGSMLTQTTVATAMGYAGDLLLDHDNPATFWERFGGEALRMVAFHYGTHALNMATGNLTVESDLVTQTKMKEARESYLKFVEGGVPKEQAVKLALDYAQGLKIDPKTGAVATELKAGDYTAHFFAKGDNVYAVPAKKSGEFEFYKLSANKPAKNAPYEAVKGGTEIYYKTKVDAGTHEAYLKWVDGQTGGLPKPGEKSKLSPAQTADAEQGFKTGQTVTPSIGKTGSAEFHLVSKNPVPGDPAFEKVTVGNTTFYRKKVGAETYEAYQAWQKKTTPPPLPKKVDKPAAAKGEAEPVPQKPYDAAALAGGTKVDLEALAGGKDKLSPADIELRKKVFLGALDLAKKFGFEKPNPFLAASFKKFAERLVSDPNPEKTLAEMKGSLELLDKAIQGRSEVETKGLKETLLSDLLLGKIKNQKAAEKYLLHLEAKMDSLDKTQITTKEDLLGGKPLEIESAKFLEQGDVFAGTPDVLEVQLHTKQGKKKITVRLDPEISEDKGGVEANLQHAFSFIDLERPFEGPQGSKVEFTGNILGQGSAATIFEAKITDASGQSKTVAVKIRTHPRPPVFEGSFAKNFNLKQWESDIRAKINSEGASIEVLADVDPAYQGMGLMQVGGDNMGLVMPAFAPESSQFFLGLKELSPADQAVARPQLLKLLDYFSQHGHFLGDVEFVYDQQTQTVHLIDTEGISLHDPASQDKKMMYRFLAGTDAVNQGSYPPAPPNPVPEVIIPKQVKVPGDIERKMVVTNDLFEKVYPNPEGRPRYLEANVIEEARSMSERLGEIGREETAHILKSDLELAMQAPYESVAYEGAIGRLAKVIALRRSHPEFSKSPVEFMGDASLKKFGGQVEKIYAGEQPEVEVATPSAKEESGVKAKPAVAKPPVSDTEAMKMLKEKNVGKDLGKHLIAIRKLKNLEEVHAYVAKLGPAKPVAVGSAYDAAAYPEGKVNITAKSKKTGDVVVDDSGVLPLIGKLGQKSVGVELSKDSPWVVEDLQGKKVFLANELTGEKEVFEASSEKSLSSDIIKGARVEFAPMVAGGSDAQGQVPGVAKFLPINEVAAESKKAGNVVADETGFSIRFSEGKTFEKVQADGGVLYFRRTKVGGYEVASYSEKIEIVSEKNGETKKLPASKLGGEMKWTKIEVGDQIPFLKGKQEAKATTPSKITPEDLKALDACEKLPIADGILHDGDPKVKLTSKVQVGDQTFFMTDVIRVETSQGPRSYAIALVPVLKPDGKTVLERRTFSKSNSGTGWVALPATIMGSAKHLKGKETYTAEIQPAKEIGDHLDAIESLDSKKSPDQRIEMTFNEINENYIHAGNRYTFENPKSKNYHDGEQNLDLAIDDATGFGKENRVDHPPELADSQAMKPGSVFSDKKKKDGPPPHSLETVVSKIDALKMPDGFLPDFSQAPQKVYSRHQALLGDYNCYDYSGGKLNGRDVIWTMAKDSQGRVWIQTIRYADAKPNSYGVYSEVIDAGILNSKPLEYKSQSGILIKGDTKGEYYKPIDDTYVDITPILSRLEPIKKFKAALEEKGEPKASEGKFAFKGAEKTKTPVTGDSEALPILGKLGQKPVGLAVSKDSPWVVQDRQGKKILLINEKTGEKQVFEAVSEKSLSPDIKKGAHLVFAPQVGSGSDPKVHKHPKVALGYAELGQGKLPSLQPHPDAGPFVIGRDKANPAVHYAIDNPAISGAHAVIFAEHDAAGKTTWYLQDGAFDPQTGKYKPSTQGTWVDGQKVNGKTAIHPGQKIRVGFVDLDFNPLTAKPYDGAALAGATSAKIPVLLELPAKTVLQDNADGKPRRGILGNAIPTDKYGSFSAATHEGVGYKPYNEDGLVQGSNWAVVLDGMGGMGHGDKACKIAGEAIANYMYEHAGEGNPAEVFNQAFIAGSQAVNESPYRAGGAVAVGHVIVKNPDGSYKAIIAHVGDARALVIGKDGKIKHATKDQSLVQGIYGSLEKGGDPNELELKMRTDPRANVVLGGLGTGNEAQPVISEIPLEPGDRIVMVSDGVSDNVASKDLAAMVASSSSAAEAQKKIFDTTLGKMADLEDAVTELKEGKRLPITSPEGNTYWIDQSYNLWDTQSGGKIVDHYKPDNLTVHVYYHDVP